MQIVMHRKGSEKNTYMHTKNKKKNTDYSSEKNPREYVCRILVLR